MTSGDVRRAGWRSPRRGRRVPYLAAGGLLVVLCVLSFAFVAVRVGDRVLVLAVTRPVAAGQLFTVADLTEVSAADDPATGLIPASEAVRVVGKAAVVPLLAGTLLTRALVGQLSFPPAGQVVSSVALKPGQYPQGLQPGAHVDVFVIADSSPNAGAPADTLPKSMPAVVLAVDVGGDGQGNTVVTVLLDQPDSARLAGAGSGRVVLMQTAPGGV